MSDGSAHPGLARAWAFGAGAAGLAYLNLGTASLFFWVYADEAAPRASAGGVGAAAFVAQLAGAAASVWTGHLSDRHRARGGRRRTFLLVSMLPAVVCAAAVLAPPVPGESEWNALWLGGAWTLAAAAYSAWCAGFLPLFAEVASTRDDRLSLSGAMALGMLAGSALALFVPLSLQVPYGAAWSMLLAAPLLVPPLFVREPSLAQRPGPLGALLRSVVADADLRSYGLRVFWLFALLQALLTLLPYVPALLAAPGAGLLTNALFLSGVLVGLPATIGVARRLGSEVALRRALTGLAAVLAFTLAVVPLLRAWPWGFAPLGLAIGACAASLLALPNAMLGDLLTGRLSRTGYTSTGLAYGLQGVVIRGGGGLAALVAGFVLPLGASGERWAGLGAVIGLAVAFALLGAWPRRRP